MKRQKTEVDYNIEPLDKPIEWITLYNKVNSIDSYVLKMTKKNLIDGTKKMLPIILLGIVILSPIQSVKIVCAILTILTSVNEIRSEIKQLGKDEKLELKEEARTIEDYYTESFKKVIATEESEDDLKYEEALEKQQKNCSQFYLVNKKPYLKKEETINFMTSIIELYYTSYKLPKLNVKNQEWDVFYDSLYEKIVDIGLEKDYSDICTTIIMYTLSKSMVNKEEEITIQNFVQTIELLEEKYGIVHYGLNKRQLLNIQKELLVNLSKIKITNILSFKKTKKDID